MLLDSVLQESVENGASECFRRRLDRKRSSDDDYISAG